MKSWWLKTGGSWSAERTMTCWSIRACTPSCITVSYTHLDVYKRQALNKKGAIVVGKVTAVDAKGATVELADGVEGYLRASEASRDRVEDATLVLSVGDEVEAKFTGVDRKNRAISLSVRAKDEADEKDAIATVNKQEDANFSNNAMAEAFKAAKGE